MSGYVLTVAPTAQAEKIAGLFRSEETITAPIGKGRSLVYVTNSGGIEKGMLFQGYAIDHDAETMTFAGAHPDHVPDPARPVEGSYFTARIDDEKIRCGADSFGFVPMAWFSDHNITAVSDSYLSLIAIRRALALPRTPNVETIRGRMWANSMSLQQLGRETFCDEIRYATPGTELRYDVVTGAIEERPLDLRAFYTEELAGHAEAVTNSAVRMIRSLKTYAAAGGIISLGLSGGTDSRVCLAGALAADIGDSLHVASTNNSTLERPNPDYAVATALSNEFSFPLNPTSSANAGRLVKNDLLAGWASTSLGLYDALYMRPTFRQRDVPAFAVGGQGAEISKGNFGWRPISAINMPPESTAQCERTLSAIGVDADDRWGSEWHYLAYRNAIHGGRATISSDYVARPAAQIPLIGLSRSELNDLPAPRKAAPSIVLDMLIKISPALAARPFDDPRKNVGSDYLEQRIAKVGGPLRADGLDPYTIHGTAHPARGLLGSHLDVATDAGFTGALDPATLLPLARPAFEVFEEHISDVIQDFVSTLDPASTRRLAAASREAGSVGKLLGLTSLI